MTQLEQLKRYTTIVADTGDLDSIARFRPQDATTNPSLLFKAAQTPACAALVTEAMSWAEQQGGSEAAVLRNAIDRLSVLVGKEILGLIPGLVSTEVDARLSFDLPGTLARARRLIRLYQDLGVPRERVLIKIASTWEGLQAAAILEQEGIHCNLTLLFGFCQAQAAAEAGVTLISPFVGRILDWYKKQGAPDCAPAEEAGVQSVQSIYRYFRACGYDTVVMGASFRNRGEILALAGCDKLTISPALLDELSQTNGDVPRVLSPEQAPRAPLPRLDEKTFRWQLNQDAMATEKLAEGIRLFTADLEKLEVLLREKRG